MGHATTHTDLSSQNIQLPAIALNFRKLAIGVAVVGLGGGAAIGYTGAFDTDAHHFWHAYLIAFLFGLTMCLGGLFFVFVQHLTRAGWSVAVRRPAEALAANLRWIWVLFLPFAALWMMGKANIVWIWADMETLKANNEAEFLIVQAKTAFLNPTFFWIRACVYFVVWAALSHFFLTNSVRQDESGDRAISSRMQKFSAPTAILFGLTITFAAFDWIMSLSPAWFSTMFGVYFFCGCATAGFAMMILITVRLTQLGALKGIVSREHFQDMGKLMWAFGIVFWAYIGFSQYMLIWYANLPEETGWFLARQIGGWGFFSFALLFGHFVLPFVGLLSKWMKRAPLILSIGAVWMLCFHYVDLYWLIMPEIPSDLDTFAKYADMSAKYADTQTHFSNPVNFLLALGVAGTVIAGTISTLSRVALVPKQDPRLAESIRFENM
ncbi:MAG: quinol:cytochrome C oxidoreductase [Planctomycetota bacterium]|nr:MAG: quinol:cytochrome C oxidoreductase [Planctomycetota bacterium]